MTNKTRIWCDIHSLLSAFFLPVALIYAITGGLYVMGIKGEAHGTKPPGMMQRFPAGTNPSLAPDGRVPKADAMMRPSGEAPNGDEARIKKPTGLYDRLMLLHKGKVGIASRSVGAAFAAAMLVMYISGIVICWSVPTRRRRMLVAAAIGLAVTIVAIVTSL